MTEEVVNTFEQLVRAGGGVAILESRGGTRTTYIDGWKIYRLNHKGEEFKTDPKAPWYHYGLKWFANQREGGTFHQRQAAALEKAKAWVLETYGEPGPWVRNRQRDYVPERVNNEFPIRRKE